MLSNHNYPLEFIIHIMELRNVSFIALQGTPN